MNFFGGRNNGYALKKNDGVGGTGIQVTPMALLQEGIMLSIVVDGYINRAADYATRTAPSASSIASYREFKESTPAIFNKLLPKIYI